jgi:hypothetical protein
MKVICLLTCLILSTSIFATSASSLIHESITELKLENLSSGLLTSRGSDSRILERLAARESKKKYIHDKEIKTNTSFEELKSERFQSHSWYPKLCRELESSDNNSSCFDELMSILKPLDNLEFSTLYVNGDKKGSDFKVLYLLFPKDDHSRLVIKMTIHDERNN